MNKNNRFIICVAVIVLMTIILSSCTGTKTVINQNSINFTGYPIKTDASLEVWTASYDDNHFFNKISEETGIKIKWLTPPAGQVDEQFNIMLASGKLPDIMEYRWAKYPGGAEKAISDDHIFPLNEIISTHSPSLKKYLSDNPDVDRMVQLDSGEYYVYPFIRGDELLKVSYGPIVRKDWLDSLNMAVPETMDDWYNMLTAFKAKSGVSAPLTYNYANLESWAAFPGAFGVKRDFYTDNEKVKYGPVEAGYKEYLQTMTKWYAEGLLDKNFATADLALIANSMLNGTSGATLGYGGSGLGAWLQSKKDDPSYQLVPAPYPVKNRGDVPRFGLKDFSYVDAAFGNAAITTSCKNIELAARFLDYGYSEAGHMLFNFGTVNESYNMIDGYPTYTEAITNNPEYSFSQSLLRFARFNNGPFVQDRRYMEQFYNIPAQKDALTVWNTQAEKTNLPPITPTYEESTELANILNNINTYVDENSTKFIMGLQSYDYYDKFLNDIKNMNVDRAIQIYEAAYERYLIR